MPSAHYAHIEEGLKQNSKPDLNKNVIQSFLVVPSSSRLTLSDETKSSNLSAKKIFLQSGIKHNAFRPPLTEQGSSITEHGQLYHFIRM